MAQRSATSFSVFPSPNSGTSGQPQQGGRFGKLQLSHSTSISQPAAAGGGVAIGSTSLGRRGSVTYRASDGLALSKAAGGATESHPRASEGYALSGPKGSMNGRGGGTAELQVHDDDDDDDDDDGLPIARSKASFTTTRRSGMMGGRASEGAALLPGQHSLGSGTTSTTSSIISSAMASRRAALAATQVVRPSSDPNDSHPNHRGAPLLSSSLGPSSGHGSGAGSPMSPEGGRPPSGLKESSSEAGTIGRTSSEKVPALSLPSLNNSRSSPATAAGTSAMGVSKGFFSKLFNKS